MTVHLFQSDPYCHDFQAVVTEIKGDWLVLDRTAFFPGGGGQVPDTGTINGLPVVDVRKEPGKILHRTPGHGITVGDVVRGELDWPRRYDLMKGHTGEHLLFSQLSRHCPELQLVKISITPVKKSVMVNGILDWNLLTQVAIQVEDAIEAALPITERMVGRDDPLLSESRVKLERIQGDNVRVIEIGDLDRAACAGVHVNNTKEIGMLLVTAVTSARPTADLEVEFVIGETAIRKARELSFIALQSAEAIGSRPQDLYSALRNVMQERERRESVLKSYEAKALTELIPLNIKGTNLYSGVFESMDKKALIDAANKITKERSACVLGSVGDRFMLIVACHQDIELDCVSILNRALAGTGGKGGGKANFASGGAPRRDGGEEAVAIALGIIKKSLDGIISK